MTPSIVIKKSWLDDDVMEFEITTSDGCSQFCINVYVGHQEFESLIDNLVQFKRQVYGGIYDITFGSFGPEYANGAFQARLHFHPPGRGHLHITVNAESDWYPFSKTEIASRATLYLKSELGLLDNFINELRSVKSGGSDSATFECMVSR